MNIKSTILIFVVIVLSRLTLIGGEGMWIPMLLQQMNEKEMQEMGMKITAEDIYSINHSSLKDAILLFGRGCTSEIISKDGLLLTNHHCGYSRIQKHSTVDHDYLTDGFWAMNKAEELPNPGLTASLLIEMKEVTDSVLAGVDENMTMKERQNAIRNNVKRITSNFESDSKYKAAIKPFFQGNEYYMMITEVFKDIRLVGAPPSNIGKFGGDTDNWMWPRHTGDFSLFRIYVDKDGNPAEYSEDNVPYHPKYYFSISLDGVQEDDFTFVFGYPARTNEYMPSYAIELITEIGNPKKIELREKRLEIFNKYSSKDPKVRLQYASKHARVSNYWKKMIGESGGIKRMKGIKAKQNFENEFKSWAVSSGNTQYASLLPEFERVYKELTPISVASNYIMEAGMAIEIIKFANSFRKLVALSKANPINEDAIREEITKLKRSTHGFFKDYYKPIDEEVMIDMLRLYDKNISTEFKPSFFNTIDAKYKDDYKAYANYVFTKSIFDKEDKLMSFLDNYKPKWYKKLLKDPAYIMGMDMGVLYNSKFGKKMTTYYNAIDSLQRIYMKAQMEMNPDMRFYPDANFTLRVSYGNASGYSPKDAVYYKHYTTLEGIMEKEDPNIYDYVVTDRLSELYNNRDYGAYADKDGTLHVGFAASNHTTGGNSGSPVLNADGQLIGVNFDRCWEGTMSDLMYDSTICRNISIDIRYFLFIVDKYAGAGYLLEEMKLVKSE
ncbi:MAG TPA: S46 family peptidase [Bacteroidales bacterium]|nr:serine protease [Bacteroidota bacterium]HJN06320.1 S46 family peptidase [Bacteroidales bacterium]|tara:strand:+ start:1732 stop:3900 length:2169 start_codon:yes stop_codon:yes gene_type:complete